VVAAAAVVAGDLEPLRRVVRELVLPGQRRLLHEDRTRQPAPGDRGGVRGLRCRGGHLRREQAVPDGSRGAGECLRAVVADAATAVGETRLVLEQGVLGTVSRAVPAVEQRPGCCARAEDRLAVVGAQKSKRGLVVVVQQGEGRWNAMPSVFIPAGGGVDGSGQFGYCVSHLRSSRGRPSDGVEPGGVGGDEERAHPRSSRVVRWAASRGCCTAVGTRPRLQTLVAVGVTALSWAIPRPAR